MAAEREVGVGVCEAAGIVRVEVIRLVDVGDEVEALGRDAGIVEAGFEMRARIVRKEDVSTRLSAQPFIDWMKTAGLAPETTPRES